MSNQPTTPSFGATLRRAIWFALGALVLYTAMTSVLGPAVGPSLGNVLAGNASVRNRHIGVVAGHWGYDSGTVCADGLQEVQVNVYLAGRVAERLRSMGASVDILEEFDDRLKGYKADAFVSVHADSCQAQLSGFKVASFSGDTASNHLATCLWDKYQTVTGLPRSFDTITHDMTDYHAFRELSAETPKAIIEVGFLGGDRQLIERDPNRIANGIVEGIVCALKPVDS